jgi:hypothetical protein
LSDTKAQSRKAEADNNRLGKKMRKAGRSCKRANAKLAAFNKKVWLVQSARRQATAAVLAEAKLEREVDQIRTRWVFGCEYVL